MKKSELKETARNHIMDAIESAMTMVSEGHYGDENKEEILEAMKKEAKRVWSLFGYEYG